MLYFFAGMNQGYLKPKINKLSKKDGEMYPSLFEIYPKQTHNGRLHCINKKDYMKQMKQTALNG